MTDWEFLFRSRGRYHRAKYVHTNKSTASTQHTFISYLCTDMYTYLCTCAHVHIHTYLSDVGREREIDFLPSARRIQGRRLRSIGMISIRLGWRWTQQFPDEEFDFFSACQYNTKHGEGGVKKHWRRGKSDRVRFLGWLSYVCVSARGKRRENYVCTRRLFAAAV